MSAIQALAGFTAWTLLLVILVFLYRGARFVTGTQINHWPRSRKPTDDMPLVNASKMPTPTAVQIGRMKGVFALRAYQPSLVASTSPPPPSVTDASREVTSRMRGAPVARCPRARSFSSQSEPKSLWKCLRGRANEPGLRSRR